MRAVQIFLLVVVAMMLNAFSSAERVVTFSKDIAPIVFTKCAMCHHSDGPAPFSLLTYAAARSHANQIAQVTKSGFMPPWKAEPQVGGEFVGQEHLTPREVELIQHWAQEGAAEGEAHDMPPVPHYTEGWQLGQPALIVRPPSYTLDAAGSDVFRIFVVPLPVDSLKFVRGLEFRPGTPRVVHHANLRIDLTSASREFDAADTYVV